MIKSKEFILIFIKKNELCYYSRPYALQLERIRLISMLILPQISLIKSLFFLQTHLIIQILVILSFIATFFIVPIPSSIQKVK